MRCNDGVWEYTNRYNKTDTSNVGPFNQARDAMFSLRTAVSREFGKGHKFNKILSGFLCAFPHVSFDRHSVEYEPWQILDKDSLENIEAFFKNLVSNFIDKHRTQRWFSQEVSLPDNETLEQLCDFLRGDFERIRTIKERLEEFDKQVKSYTDEQYRILDHIPLNDRSVTQGSAGTGKTMIAMESAARSALEGKSVFLSCFNRLIGEWMQKQLEEYEEITVSSLHRFLFEESKGFDYDRTMENKQDFYSRYLPGLLTDIYTKGISPKFDKLIIDEGQDLIREEYLDLFDSMLKGGLANGQWEVYGDFERQAIFAQRSREDMFSLIGKYDNPSKFFLKINCRNTKQIGEETSLISGFETPPFLLEYLEGIPVEYAFFNSPAQQKELVLKQLNQLFEKDLPRNDLIILSQRKFENSCISSLSGVEIRNIKHTNEIVKEQEYLGFTTVQSYKGMESNYVMITDIVDLESEAAKSLLYVAMSRARYGLIMLVSESVRDQYKKILRNKLN